MEPEERNATAARILAAADELLAEVGYDGVSVRAVAERAGAKKALVFYYFGSKAELFGRVLERYYAGHLEALERAYAGGGTPRERLHRLIASYLDYIDANRRYPRLVQQQVASGNPDDELVRRNLVPLFQWTTRALAGITPERGPLAARQFFLTFAGIVTTYYTHAPVLGDAFGVDPFAPESLATRREHVHWMLDAALDRLERE